MRKLPKSVKWTLLSQYKTEKIKNPLDGPEYWAEYLGKDDVTLSKLQKLRVTMRSPEAGRSWISDFNEANGFQNIWEKLENETDSMLKFQLVLIVKEFCNNEAGMSIVLKLPEAIVSLVTLLFQF
eukprot:TRINITY_DN5052_c0_g1_i1.p1 TRINITY_DN5052_c0_g1~~TRINITY_DN5052_c0_g1_i1.p1  ORF type:complete len:125 (-),score=21.77 TRINITY_DN5052_c0_g1_i1:171-545(-)